MEFITLFLVLLALFIAVAASIAMASFVYTAIRYVPFVPTQGPVVKQMIEAAQLKDGQVVYDLGCGDGRFLIQAMKKAQVKAVGVEVSWIVYGLALLRRWWSAQKPSLIRGDFFQVDLSEADVVFCYLFPKPLQQLKDKFEQELKSGARVISFSFPIEGWTPAKTLTTRPDKPQNFLIYIYHIP